MKRLLSFSFVASALLVALALRAQTNNPSAAERFAAPDFSLVAKENSFWKRTPMPAPDEVVLEVSGIVALPGKRLLVTSRRGEVWFVDGAYDDDPHPRYTLFASGLHE